MQQLAPTLESIQKPVRADLDLSFDEIRRIVVTDFPMIAGVNEHLLRLKGKMMRPTVLLLAAKSVGEVTQRERMLAAVVELIHVATLVHDDSVDHSPLRRGQPTVNQQFSHQVAVIMGDYLYSRAIVELVRLDDMRPLRVIAGVTNDMTVGEMRQLEAHDVLDYSEESYDLLIKAKTASLISGACEVGAMAGPDQYLEPLKRFGMLLGMAFQVTDDVIDYTETEAVTGKPGGLDLKEHKVTLPLIYALPRMTDAEVDAVKRLMSEARPAKEMIDGVIAIVEERGGIEAARNRAASLADQAAAELDALPESEALSCLRDCITYAIERRR